MRPGSLVTGQLTGSSTEAALLRLLATASAEETRSGEGAADVVGGRRRFPKERA